MIDWTMNGSQIAASQAVTFQGNPVTLDASWSVAGVGDFNGDGKADILLASNGAFFDWDMNGSQITSAQMLTFQGNPAILDASWSVAGVGDFNGDGKADILLRNTNGTLVDWTMNGSQIAAGAAVTYQGTPVILDASWSVAGVGDFNGDGKADILLRNTNGTFFDWDMNGSQITSVQMLTFQGNPVILDASWSVAQIGDFNGDGKADILLRNTNGSVIDWTMNGSQITSAQAVTLQGNPVTLPGSAKINANPATGGPGSTQLPAADQTSANPIVGGGSLGLLGGAVVNGPITFPSGAARAPLGTAQASLPDTAMGFTDSADRLSFSGGVSAPVTPVVAPGQLVNGATLLSAPDPTPISLGDATHIGAAIVA